MARYIIQGESIFIPFKDGVSITDSQLHLRMYKTEKMFKRYFPTKTKYDVLCEYAPVVRCKYCKRWSRFIDAWGACRTGLCVLNNTRMGEDEFCSCGERNDHD